MNIAGQTVEMKENCYPTKKRNSTFDFMKCAAIFMVIWQHCILYLPVG